MFARRIPAWSAALVAALVVAEASALLLRPRDGLVEPSPVQVQSYFSGAEIDRAQAFRGPQRALGLGVMAIEAGLLVWLVAQLPRRLRTTVRRPLLAGAVAGAALSVLLGIAPLGVHAVARERAMDVGLVTQSWVGWAGDVAKSLVIGAVLAGLGAAVALGLMRRLPRAWWAAGAGGVVMFGCALTFAAPVVLDPLFNRFERLPEGRARADVLALARKAGVKVGEVYEMDASRRTTAANAYVTGLGTTKRVVLYDTLLENFTRDELRLVVAHELGHVHHRDVPRGLLFLLLVAPAGMFAVAAITRRLAPDGAPGPATVPALALAVAIVSTPVTMISHSLSRAVEARADAFSLRLTDAPDAFRSFERRITVRNVSDPDPPRYVRVLTGTHPSTIERIGIADAYERSRGR